MEKKKIIKLAIIVLLLILIIVLIIIQSNKDKYVGTPELQNAIVYEEGINLVSNHSTFYSVEKLINKFLLYLQVENKEAVYNLLDKSYIESNKITKENVMNNFQDLVSYNGGTIEIEEMYEQENEKNAKYHVFGRIEKNGQRKEIYLVFYIDSYNVSFSILPINKEIYGKGIKSNKDDIIEEKTIKNNKYNKMKIEILSEEDRVLKIFKEFIHNELYYPEYSYNKIDKEYRDKKFGSLQKYREYINLNYDKLSSLDSSTIKAYEEFSSEEEYLKYISSLKTNGLNKYKIEKEGSYIRYICIDDYGNYYIFKEASPFRYTVILDTYTIDLPEFIEKYNSSSEQQKIALNIQKFFEAINNRDYKYAYSCLADSFKNNYFKTQEEFESYAKTNFYNNNAIEYVNFEKQGKLYTYRVSITNKETGKQIKKTFIMQLGEGTEFKLSFDR